MLGPKMSDGLRAYASRGDEFADEWLVARGYPPKVAASIIDRLARKGFIDCGVSARSGWLTDEGRKALEGQGGEVR